MTTRTLNSTPTPCSYVDFDPPTELKKEDGLQTLLIDLPEFKKEKLRVQVSKGVIKVSGERPISANGSKRSRFLIETKLPEGCDINHVRAKFISGCLHVSMPIKKVVPVPQQQQQQAASKTSEPPREEIPEQKPKAEAPGSDDMERKYRRKENRESGASKTYDGMFKHEGMLQKLQGKKKLILGFGVAVVTMVGIGALVASNHGSSDIAISSFLFVLD